MASQNQVGAFVCDVSGGCPCYAIPAAACFARDTDWRFEASGRNASRSLERHRALHALHNDRAHELQELAGNYVRLENAYQCKLCKNSFRELKRVLHGHACRSTSKVPNRAKRVIRLRTVPRKVKPTARRRFFSL